MRNLTHRAMRFVNEDVNITCTDFAKQMLEPSFDKVVPIVNFQKYGVSDGHEIINHFHDRVVDLVHPGFEN